MSTDRHPGGIAAVVTGHTRGLGAGIAAHLLERKARVLGIARHGNGELARRHRDRLSEERLDLSDLASLRRWLDGGSLARFLEGAAVAVLVNNAGVVQPVGPLDMQDPAAVAAAVAVNVGAPLMLSAAFASVSRSARDRRVLHISSGAASYPIAGWSVYCATKAALDMHARAAALDAAPGLRVASVAPGVIDTEMQASIRRTPVERFPGRARFVAMKEQGQLADPGDAGRAVVEFLFSDAFGREPVTDLRSRR